MAKGSGSGCRWEKVHTAKGLSRNDLCALRLLFVNPLVFNPGGSKGKEESLSIKSLRFCPYTEKALRTLRALRLIFFILGGRRDFYNSLRNKKTG